MFHLSLFGIRSFTAGNIANLLSALGRGGLQFILIIWLQGIWLPRHGYDYESTPLWAGIYMVPLTIGFLIAGPLSGVLSDRHGARWYAAGGMLVAAVSFLLMGFLPVDFPYYLFAILLAVNGLAMGLFSSPNRASIMNSVPARQRGAAAGMTATFQNGATVLSIGIFFSMLILGLASTLPAALFNGLTGQGVPAGVAGRIAELPPVSTLFAALLGYNPIETLLGPGVLAQVGPEQAGFLTGRSFFPELISGPFADGLFLALGFAAVCCLVAAIASLFDSAKPSVREAESAGEALGSGEALGEEDRSGTAAARPVAVAGRILAPDAPVAAVLTLVDAHGREADRAETDDEGRFALSAGGRSGDYLVIATPRGRGAAAPAATRVTINGSPVHVDVVLPERAAVR